MAPLAAFRRVVLVGSWLGAVACHSGAKPAAPPLPAAPAAIALRVSYDEARAEAHVEASYPAGTRGVFAVESGCESFVTSARASSSGAPLSDAERGDDGTVHVDCARGCRIDYVVALGAAARAKSSIDTARSFGPIVVAPPSTWALLPVDAPDGEPVVLDVRTRAGTRFVSGLGASSDGLRRTTVRGVRRGPYSSFGPFDVLELREGGGSLLDVALPRGRRRPGDLAISRWVTASARAVREALGTFPAPHAAVIVIVVPGDDVHVGFSMGGSSILAVVGEDTSEERLARDWVLTHELLHFVLPSQPEARDWAEEGLATYVEPLVRARAGLVSREEAWAGLVRGFPNGQPAAGDRGLDRTRTWGRVYWGGALFFFEADYAIRAATNGKKTLLSALGAMVRAGFVNGSPASLEAAFAEGDREVGASVLVPMLARYGVTPEAFPYERHLEELGVRPSGERVSLDATASRAAWLGAF
ncbi:MAG: hypothetical protein U0183_33220 [Polyangiaceae bacterium]